MGYVLRRELTLAHCRAQTVSSRRSETRRATSGMGQSLPDCHVRDMSVHPPIAEIAAPAANGREVPQADLIISVVGAAQLVENYSDNCLGYALRGGKFMAQQAGCLSRHDVVGLQINNQAQNTHSETDQRIRT